MIIKPEPVFAAVRDVESRFESARAGRRILLSPQGRPLDANFAQELSEAEGLLLVCGRYEGFDERVRDGLDLEELSIGDYVLSGGELAAMVLIDCVTRLLPGVLGNEESTEHESFCRGRLDFPQYTRPPEFEGRKVPEVLLSGDHRRIEQWRDREAFKRTYSRRRDLVDPTSERRDRVEAPAPRSGGGIHDDPNRRRPGQQEQNQRDEPKAVLGKVSPKTGVASPVLIGSQTSRTARKNSKRKPELSPSPGSNSEAAGRAPCSS